MSSESVRPVDSAPVRAPSTAAEGEPPGQPYTLDKPASDDLDVQVFPMVTGGTTHGAARVHLRGPGGDELSIATPDDALAMGRPLAPLLELQRDVDAKRVLLLGWSSTGGGMQTYHALLITKKPVRVVGELRWASARGAVGLAVSGSRVGVPEPSSAESELSFDDRHWDRAALDELRYAPPAPDATFYAAPFRHDEARSRAARYAFIDLAAAPGSQP